MTKFAELWEFTVRKPAAFDAYSFSLLSSVSISVFCVFISGYFLHFERMEPLAAAEIKRAVELALTEDIGSGDVTTIATVPATTTATAVMAAREPLVIAGLALAEAAFRQLSSEVKIVSNARDGDSVGPGNVLLTVSGPARALLAAERVSLNFVQRLSGVATLASQFVQAVKGTRAQILDTRKTTPGWRRLEKYAVTCGGGHNHRMGLYDMVLIKDNHLAALSREVSDPVAAAIQRARAQFPQLKVEIEADNLEQVDKALNAGVDLILLDNMNPVQLRLAVQKCKGRAQTEASGGINLASVRAVAEAGVDFVSVGALTHSARAMDIGLDFQL
jgi:nicotinate-nucleotide pyrophosphorylase (carboxylating)